MQEVGIQQVCNQIEQAIATEQYAHAEAMLWPAIDQYPEVPLFYFYAGNLMFRTYRNTACVLFYERGLELEPNSAVMSNLGAAYRRLNLNEESRAMLLKSVEYDPLNGNSWVNLAAAYVNEGDPEPGIQYGKQALKCEEGYKEFQKDRAKWNLGLLYLEKGAWRQGFRYYRAALGFERVIRTYAEKGGLEAPLLDPRTHSQAKGKGKTVVVWGEQGLGDELMFGSLIYRLKKDYNVIFDCHPRLEWLHRQAHRDIEIHPTRKSEDVSWARGKQIDFKLPIGDLGALYIEKNRDFIDNWREHGPFYHAPEGQTEEYRQRLKKMANGRKIVGLACRGGVVQTHRSYRVIPPNLLAALLNRDDIMYVSLDYEDVSMLVDYIASKQASHKYYWPKALLHSWDYHNSAALAAATDCNITVAQSIAHMSASMGHPTKVLVPSKPAWRYGLTDERWMFYPSPKVKLYRQIGDDWNGAIERVLEDLDNGT